MWQVLKIDDDEEDLYCCSMWRERKYNKVQTCFGLKTFTAYFCLSWTWGFFKACLVILTGSYKTDSSYIYIYAASATACSLHFQTKTKKDAVSVLKDDEL